MRDVSEGNASCECKTKQTEKNKGNFVHLLYSGVDVCKIRRLIQWGFWLPQWSTSRGMQSNVSNVWLWTGSQKCSPYPVPQKQPSRLLLSCDSGLAQEHWHKRTAEGIQGKQSSESAYQGGPPSLLLICQSSCRSTHQTNGWRSWIDPSLMLLLLLLLLLLVLMALLLPHGITGLSVFFSSFFVLQPPKSLLFLFSHVCFGPMTVKIFRPLFFF